MNLLNEKVEHSKFGTGVIKSNENGVIRIAFDMAIGEKAFIYPDAFSSFLKLNNPQLNEQVQYELSQIGPEKEKQSMEADRQKKAEQLAKQEQAKQKLKAERAIAAKAAKKAKAS